MLHKEVKDQIEITILSLQEINSNDRAASRRRPRIILKMKPIILSLIVNSQMSLSQGITPKENRLIFILKLANFYTIMQNFHRICNRCQTLLLALIFSQLPFSRRSPLQNYYHIHIKNNLINKLQFISTYEQDTTKKPSQIFISNREKKTHRTNIHLTSSTTLTNIT